MKWIWLVLVLCLSSTSFASEECVTPEDLEEFQYLITDSITKRQEEYHLMINKLDSEEVNGALENLRYNVEEQAALLNSINEKQVNMKITSNAGETNWSVPFSTLKLVGYILLTIVTIIALIWARKKTNGEMKRNVNDNT